MFEADGVQRPQQAGTEKAIARSAPSIANPSFRAELAHELRAACAQGDARGQFLTAKGSRASARFAIFNPQ